VSSRLIAAEGVRRAYDWGSPTAIPALLGLEPSGEPIAELWFGAHPGGPSPAAYSGGPSPGVARGDTLDALIAADPVGLLGAPTSLAFGDRLPFLLKVLAADRALSIQVHPTIAQARAGYDAEDAAGIARDAPERNYRDRNHKPELLCALSPFDALCGFRPVAGTLRLLAALELAELAPIAELLRGPDSLRAAFVALLDHPAPASLAEAVTAALPRLAAHGEWAALGVELTRVATDFPGDVGLAVALLLNHVRLAPGQAIYLPAGNVHAYLRGTAIEIMANSDNVLRCGLTGKHVDVAELLRVADFSALAEPRWPAADTGEGIRTFQVPLPDFQLAMIDLPAAGAFAELDQTLPQLVLSTSGTVSTASVVEAGDHARITPGSAVFVAPGPSPAAVHGDGTVFIASPGPLRREKSDTTM